MGKMNWTDPLRNEEVLRTWNQEGKEHPACNKTKKSYWDWSHISQELPSKARF